jgi:hypothetical protein
MGWLRIKALILAVSVALLPTSHLLAGGGTSGASAADPFVLKEIPNSATLVVGGYKNTNGLTPRQVTINPAQQTLVLLVAGQSQWTSVNPTLYVPSNTAVIHNLNPYDGAFYPITGKLLGSSDTSGIANAGPGHPAARLADKLIARGWNQVIIEPIAIGGTTVAQWNDPNTILSDRFGVAMRRLAAKGITPATTGVTFAVLWGQGEADTLVSTPQASYTASYNGVLATISSVCSTCRVFTLQESWISGSTSAAVRAAQAASWNGTTNFNGGDMDSLNATNRIADNTHLNDTGAAAIATIVDTAMHASGAPF